VSIERRRIGVQGVVQGVGFRPFVYRLAVSVGLSGSVRNLGDAGVEIQIEGETPDLETFLRRLKDEIPPLAQISNLDQVRVDPTGESGFAILASTGEGRGRGALPPDTSICDACVEDLLGQSRYEGYWATSCTDCGPRFTVIEGLPYDRPLTSMSDFPMCEPCHSEYSDPLNRRYHAQTIACATCGPVLSFDGETEDPIRVAAAAIAVGAIVAIKGIGGTHIACDATNADAARSLRERLGRPGQPFALMAREEDVASFVEPSEEELTLLQSPQRPIVVIRSKPDALPESVAPGLHTVGVMLPYTGLHVLLLQELARPLVMTSANLPGQPMLIENGEIERRLQGIADHFLLHNRRIVARCDDSVHRRSGGATTFIRRSRGYVPQSIPADMGSDRVLALGPETGLTFALYDGDGKATLSQHIGSVNDLETYEFLREAIAHLQGLTGITQVDAVACDLHPQFMTSRLAAELADAGGLRRVPVQHHEAHLVSLLVEHDLDECVGIILDGYGYGHDGQAWGGEILVGTGRRIRRVGSLEPVRLPGGDLSAQQPLRMVASFLHQAGWSWNEISKQLADRALPDEAIESLRIQLGSGVNAPWTTSAGRFLDAVAAWIGVATARSYEGEPAMRLEAAAIRGEDLGLRAPMVECGERMVLDTSALFAMLAERFVTSNQGDIAATAQCALAEGMANAAIRTAESSGIGVVGFSGGVAYNDAIASSIRARVERAGLRYVTNELVPCGDGGVSLGQIGYAADGWLSESSPGSL